LSSRCSGSSFFLFRLISFFRPRQTEPRRTPSLSLHKTKHCSPIVTPFPRSSLQAMLFFHFFLLGLSSLKIFVTEETKEVFLRPQKKSLFLSPINTALRVHTTLPECPSFFMLSWAGFFVPRSLSFYLFFFSRLGPSGTATPTDAFPQLQVSPPFLVFFFSTLTSSSALFPPSFGLGGESDAVFFFRCT